MTTLNIDSCLTLHNTSQRIVFVFGTIFVSIRTATATIDVATEGISSTRIRYVIRCIFRRTIIIYNRLTCSNTYNTFLYIYDGILEGVTILTTSIDRPLNPRTCFNTGITNNDMRTIYPSHTVVRIDAVITRSSHVTT